MVGVFDPERHHRQSIRLPTYDYAGAGGYFVTLCTSERVCSLGALCDGRLELTAAGHIVERVWLLLPQRLPRVALDAFIVMPNHIHGILVMHEGAAPAGEDASASR